MEHINWYPRLWIDGTRALSIEERGVYFELINLMYDLGGPVPEEHRWLAGVCGLSTRRFRAVLKRLIEADKITRVSDDSPLFHGCFTGDSPLFHGCFTGFCRSKLSAKRVEAELTRCRNAIEQRVNARASGMRKKQLQRVSADGRHDGNHDGRHDGRSTAVTQQYDKIREDIYPLTPLIKSLGSEEEQDQLLAPDGKPFPQPGRRANGTNPRSTTNDLRSRGANPRAATADPPPPTIVMPDPDTEWGRICERVRLEIGDAAYRIAVVPMRLASPPNGAITLLAPSTFLRDYARANCQQVIARVAGVPVDIVTASSETTDGKV